METKELLHKEIDILLASTIELVYKFMESKKK
jgi:hypothetical protein